MHRIPSSNQKQTNQNYDRGEGSRERKHRTRERPLAGIAAGCMKKRAVGCLPTERERRKKTHLLSSAMLLRCFNPEPKALAKTFAGGEGGLGDIRPWRKNLTGTGPGREGGGTSKFLLRSRTFASSSIESNRSGRIIRTGGPR